MNVLVYNGPGTALHSTERTLAVLKAMLKGRCDVLAVGAEVLLHEDKAWQASTALLVIPGGRDLPYVESLGNNGTNAIREWVKGGGRYLGICAGGYFGSRRVEFEVGSVLEVVGDRKLALVDVIARGSATPGFVYNSEDGARSVGIRELGDSSGYQFNAYCNGAPYFHVVDPSNVEVLATYHSNEVENCANGKPAIVQSKFGKGHVVLTGPHLEHNQESAPSLNNLADWDKHQRRLLECILLRMGLSLDPPVSFYLNETEKSQPLRLSAMPDVSNNSWINTFIKEHGQTASETGLAPLISSMCLCTTDFLKVDRSQLNLTYSTHKFGTRMLYAISTSSTQTILEKNYKLSTHLPSGLVCLATNQYSGRGRGSNSWVSQDGCLQFSMTMHHREGRSAVFLQYLFGLAVAEGICGIEGYSEIPVRLKWPNDIYCYSKDESGAKALKKIGGILVNSSYMNGVFNVACGLNVANSLPTLSINDLIAQHNQETGKKLAPLSLERVLSRILATFEQMYQTFSQSSTFAFEPFLEQYYSRWLHSDQYVYLKERKLSARICGIDSSGLLKAEGVDDREIYLLQPDGNSFDMMKGLISRKQ
ncbi:biotin-protein ligase [Obelidium mucronatum]|nr:biotin-protein ligase [Obelidium mucronatum]